MRPLRALAACALLAGCHELPVGARAAPEVLSGSHGGRSFRLFVPSGYRPGTPVPLLLMLHGCFQGADAFAAATRMNVLAERDTFLVLYPEQSSSANPVGCWLWYEAAHQERGQGEMAILAGLVDRVRASHSVDPGRIHAAGFSAGGASVVLLGAAYPEVFASLAVQSGLEYRAARSAIEAFPAMAHGGPDPAQQGRLAHQAMGPRARVVPILVAHGTSDATVNPINGHQVLAQWAQTSDLADDGMDNDSVTDRPVRTRTGQVPGGRAFVHTSYLGPGGRVIMEKYLVEGMGHAWSGGAAGSYGDPAGPDLSALAWAFFQAHPLPGIPDGGAADLAGPDGAPDLPEAGVPDALPDGGGQVLAVRSIGSEDGYAGALPVDGASVAEHKVGDRGLYSRDTFRLILSFDLPPPPAGMRLRGARLRLVRRSLTGSVSRLELSLRSGAFGSSPALAQEDHSAPASASAVASSPPPEADGASVELELPAVALAHLAPGGRIQMRLRAETTPGLAPSTLHLHGGEDEPRAPRLLLRYEP